MKLVPLLALCITAPLPALNFGDLQQLVRAAQAGQTIVVPRGDYVGQLVIDRAVVLKAEPGARLIHERYESGPTLWIRAAGTVVDGLGVYGSGEGGRRDHTAVVVSARGVVLTRLTVTGAWSGLWIEKADSVTVDGMTFRGLSDFPFWERGEGVRVTGSKDTRLNRLDLWYASDGLAVEDCVDTAVQDVAVAESRYGVHLMFSAGGTLSGAKTRRSVAGLMAMESTAWTVNNSSFTEGYRTGSAGIRQIRTSGIRVENSVVSRQSSGIELLDARNGVFSGNRIEENAVAWTWGGDNSATVVTLNQHRGNLVDAAGSEADEASLAPSDAHDHGTKTTTKPSGLSVAPTFDGNGWDAWKGFDLDGDGFGDTAYRFDRAASTRAVSRPWAGLFLGSPWSVLSQALPGGEVLDPRPRIY